MVHCWNYSYVHWIPFWASTRPDTLCARNARSAGPLCGSAHVSRARGSGRHRLPHRLPASRRPPSPALYRLASSAHGSLSSSAPLPRGSSRGGGAGNRRAREEVGASLAGGQVESGGIAREAAALRGPRPRPARALPVCLRRGATPRALPWRHAHAGLGGRLALLGALCHRQTRMAAQLSVTRCFSFQPRYAPGGAARRGHGRCLESLTKASQFSSFLRERAF